MNILFGVLFHCPHGQPRYHVPLEYIEKYDRRDGKKPLIFAWNIMQIEENVTELQMGIVARKIK